MSLSRTWCFTSFDDCWEYEPIQQHITYVVWQIEKCPDTGRLHAQGYLETKKMISHKEAKSLIFKNNEHFEKRKGSQKQAIDYCKKNDTREDGPWEWGQPTKQGQRNDLIAIKNMIDEGHTDLEVAQEHFGSWIRYNKSFDKYSKLTLRCREEPPTVIILWGPAGCGKTSFVYKKTSFVYKTHKTVYSKDNSKWWDGYHQQEAILFDDINWNDLDRREILLLCDRYPLKKEFKGGYVEINSPYIYFTSNFNPEGYQIYDDALKRRINEIIPM
ncbi:replicase [Molossus molossus circovirus 4]|uniref:replicase n=1 Tax=Molossus molossus circovirus 4 TaxID=1959845 RepID=UPI000CA344C6|nr:replicase [Molossus molossus circovirus 4]AQR57902.1 replicase [Molossus molossus circovirus 4]